MKPDVRMGMDGLLGFSAQMQRVYRLIHAASAHSYPLLIHGESGTEKNWRPGTYTQSGHEEASLSFP